MFRKYRSLLIMLLAITLSANILAQETKRDTLGFPVLPLRSGDRCIVCGMELGEEGIVILFKGRRVPLFNHDKLQLFLQDPDIYFRKLQARGALFQEDATAALPLTGGWLGLSFVVLFALIFGGLSVPLALRKGFSPLRWFFIGLLGNVLGFLYLLSRPAEKATELPPGFAKIPETHPPKNCDGCGAELHPSTEECPDCGKQQTSVQESEVKRAGLPVKE